MPVVKFDPLRGFESIANRMNDFLNEFQKGGMRFEYGSFAPIVDISEDEKNIFIQAELPGLSKEDVKLSMNDDNILVIKGEKKREEKVENKEKTFIKLERNFGSFTRSFMLPDNVKTDNINAKFENGILDITLEKVEPQKPKEINVEIK